MTIRILKYTLTVFLLLLFTGFSFIAFAANDAPMDLIDAQIKANPDTSGVYVLDTGTEALLARAWLADNARKSIDIQYFIWSTDNIGILAAEALLRAAQRGVRVRVIVDDLLIDAPDKSLLAMSRHPNIEIRIYNPKVSVGVPMQTRLLNLLTRFRGVNQRMHNKVVVVDGKISITGGRNMAAEYYDYNHEYNFRDRDVLMLGETVKSIQASFEEYWNSDLTVNVEDRFNGWRLMKKNVNIEGKEIQEVYRDLHAYAKMPENFAPEVRAAIADVPSSFATLAQQIVWGQVDFISDRPGKNDSILSLGGGGQATLELAKLVEKAKKSVVIQSPYLVLSDEAIELFRRCIAQGVTVRINTNSLASTDNLQAFSGYRNQRKRLLDMGIQIYECKPQPDIQQKLMQKIPSARNKIPIFSLHAKTMVIDKEIVFIGTFNLDPRSENLNTEAGAIIHNSELARKINDLIEIDMAPENSWDASKDDPDQYNSFTKLNKVRLYQMMPIKPLL